MKNILKLTLLISLFAMFSCAAKKEYHVSLNPKITSEDSVVGEGKTFTLTVADNRKNKEIIGKKKFGNGEFSTIKLKKDIKEVIASKMTKNLLDRGFKKGKDELIGVHIVKLNYESERGFIISDSSIEIRIRVAIKDSDSGKIMTKDYGLNFSKSHLGNPSAEDDAYIISENLSEVLDEILHDEDFVGHLVR